MCIAESLSLGPGIVFKIDTVKYPMTEKEDVVLVQLYITCHRSSVTPRVSVCLPRRFTVRVSRSRVMTV